MKKRSRKTILARIERLLRAAHRCAEQLPDGDELKIRMRYDWMAIWRIQHAGKNSAQQEPHHD
jgi:hypothetical protein